MVRWMVVGYLAAIIGKLWGGGELGMPGNAVSGVFHCSFILCGREGWKGVRGDYGGGEVLCHVMFLVCVKREKERKMHGKV